MSYPTARQGTTITGPTHVLTRSEAGPSDLGPIRADLTVPGAGGGVGNVLVVGTTFGMALSGVLFTVSGTFAGARIAIEASCHDNLNLWRPWHAYRIDHGISTWVEWLAPNLPVAFWVPANGALAVRLRLANLTSGSLAVGASTIHGPSPMGVATPMKCDWVGYVTEAVPGNNVDVLIPIVTMEDNINNGRTPTAGGFYTVPVGRRLRIHSWSGAFLAGVAGGRCLAQLRSNLGGATTASSDLLGHWSFGPSAGGTNPDERWSGFSGTFAQPHDFYNYGLSPSLGIVAKGSSGTTGKLTFNLYGYLVG